MCCFLAYYLSLLLLPFLNIKLFPCHKFALGSFGSRPLGTHQCPSYPNIARNVGRDFHRRKFTGWLLHFKWSSEHNHHEWADFATCRVYSQRTWAWRCQVIAYSAAWPSLIKPPSLVVEHLFPIPSNFILKSMLSFVVEVPQQAFISTNQPKNPDFIHDPSVSGAIHK